MSYLGIRVNSCNFSWHPRYLPIKILRFTKIMRKTRLSWHRIVTRMECVRRLPVIGSDVWRDILRVEDLVEVRTINGVRSDCIKTGVIIPRWTSICCNVEESGRLRKHTHTITQKNTFPSRSGYTPLFGATFNKVLIPTEDGFISSFGRSFIVIFFFRQIKTVLQSDPTGLRNR